MAGRDEFGGECLVTYCVVPRALAPRLHAALRTHFASDPDVEVIVERRGPDRRAPGDRRTASEQMGAGDRRRVYALEGRRVADRRGRTVLVPGAPLPRRARPYADRLQFVERLQPSRREAEDLDTARLVARIQAGDRDAYALLYLRYFDRVYGYLRVMLRDAHDAEDAAQDVFAKVFEALPGYQRRSQPFRAWLFVVVRNLAISYLRRGQKTAAVAPDELDRQLETAGGESDVSAIDWITDRELLMFVERLPLAQRQVLLLRFMLGMDSSEIAAILGRSSADVRVLQGRALGFLRQRLVSLGREPRRAIPPARIRRSLRPAHVLRSRRFALLR
jgi:RNA polymerase sigma-70 factor (ECF subfamily)